MKKEKVVIWNVHDGEASLWVTFDKKKAEEVKQEYEEDYKEEGWKAYIERLEGELWYCEKCEVEHLKVGDELYDIDLTNKWDYPLLWSSHED